MTCVQIIAKTKPLASRLFRLALAPMLALAAQGCASEEIADPRRSVLSEWVDTALIGDYQELVSAASQLELAVQDYCLAPTEPKWRHLQGLWWQARAPWKRTEIFAFGPYSDNPWRLGAKIDFWPARPAAIDKTLSDTSIELTPASVAMMGSAQTGLPVLEYLLFRHEGDYVPADARTCAYLGALAHDLKVDAQAMVDAWSVQGYNYRLELLEASQETLVFEDLDDALSEVVNRMGFTLENIRRDKLRKVLGSGGAGAKLDQGESRWSGRGLEDIRDNLRGMERLVFGPGGRFAPRPLPMDKRSWEGLPTSLTQMLAFRGVGLRDRLALAFSACYAALDAIPVSLAHAAVHAPQSIETAIVELGNLQKLMQGEVMAALALTITFNDADGD